MASYGYPMGYGYGAPPYGGYQQPQFPQTQPQPQQAIQNGGFVSVRNIEEARNWPIAPGNSVTFKDESAPYIYTKTMSYNQLDTPRFERFRLVREEEQAPVAQTQNAPVSYATKEEVETIRREVEGLKMAIKPPKQTEKIEEGVPEV